MDSMSKFLGLVAAHMYFDALHARAIVRFPLRLWTEDEDGKMRPQENPINTAEWEFNINKKPAKRAKRAEEDNGD